MSEVKDSFMRDLDKEASGIDGRIRPDQLTPEEWALLAQIPLPENGLSGKDE